jgi:hypothetical protein
VKLGEDLAAQPVLPLLIRLDVGTGQSFVQHAAIQRVSLTQATRELDTLAQNLDVYEICQSQRHYAGSRQETYRLGASGNLGR